MKHYSRKVIISGSVVEVISYSKPVWVEFSRHGAPGERKNESSPEQSLRRARTTVRRLISSNIGQYGDCKPVFLTLTFADNVTSIEQANDIYGNFLKRLNYHVFGQKCSNLKWVVVPEFQERGAVHYHVVFFNLPYVPAADLAKVWGQGFIKITAIDEIDSLGSYVSKYITKETADDRLTGKKHYWASRGLLQPVSVTDENDAYKAIEENVLTGKEEVMQSTFESDYYGEVKYQQYRPVLPVGDVRSNRRRLARRGGMVDQRAKTTKGRIQHETAKVRDESRAIREDESSKVPARRGGAQPGGLFNDNLS